MAGLPSKYFKMHPGNLKKAWAAYRADRGGAKKAAPRRKKKHTRARVKRRRKSSGSPSPANNHGGDKMAKRKKRRGVARAKSVARKGVRRLKELGSSRPGQVLISAAQAAVGGVATSFALNNIPKVKDMSTATKSGAQVALGLAGIFFGKNRWMKSLGAGSVIAGVFGITKEVLKLNPLAGPGPTMATLPPDVMRRLINRGSMGLPARVRMGLPANVRMGLPARVRMSGSNSYGGVAL